MSTGDRGYLAPEQEARRRIDAMLVRAGWIVQDYRAVNLYAGVGVAVREVPTDAGPADYVLFVESQAVGIIEAKKAGTTLSGVEPSVLLVPQDLNDQPASVLLERIRAERASAPAATRRKAVTS